MIHDLSDLFEISEYYALICANFGVNTFVNPKFGLE